MALGPELSKGKRTFPRKASKGSKKCCGPPRASIADLSSFAPSMVF